jgi:hypothetical protein
MRKKHLLFCAIASCVLVLTSCSLFGSGGGASSSSSILTSVDHTGKNIRLIKNADELAGSVSNNGGTLSVYKASFGQALVALYNLKGYFGPLMIALDSANVSYYTADNKTVVTSNDSVSVDGKTVYYAGIGIKGSISQSQTDDYVCDSGDLVSIIKEMIRVYGSIPDDNDLPDSEKITVIATPLANSAYCSIKAGPFFNRSVTNFVVPKTVDGMKVKSIEKNGFANSAKLQSVTFESGSKVDTIASGAFSGCSSLSYVFIPDTVETISGAAFKGNSEDILFFLEAPSRPSGWASNDYYSDQTWNYHQGVCHWGKTDYEIGTDGFVYSTRLDGTAAIARYDGDETAITVPSEHNGSKVSEISSQAFYKKTKIKTVNLPATIELFGSDCFNGCLLLSEIRIGRVSGGAKTAINSGAFSGCSSLSYVFIPDTVETISGAAFKGNSEDILFFLEAPSRPSGWASSDYYSDQTWNYHQGVCHWGKTDYEIGTDGFVYSTRLDGTAAIARYDGDETAITVPSEHNGAKVTEISTYAFAKHTKIKSVVFPSSIILYQSYCFSGCILLHEIEIPSPAEGKSGTIETHAFGGCTALKYVVIHSYIDTIAAAAFVSNASGIIFFCSASSRPSGWASSDYYSEQTWNYKQGTTYWSNDGYYANEETGWVYGLRYSASGSFYQLDYCPDNVASIVVPDTVPSGTVKGIGSYALAKKSKLTSLTLPSQTIEIRDHALYQDNLLTSLTLPSSLEKLGDNALDGCSSLDYVVIPASVSYIGSNCFDNHQTNFKIFVEGKSSAPDGWYHNILDSGNSWDGGALVYWQGQWHYNAAGVPVFG